MVIIWKEPKNNKIEFTKKELEDLMQKVYDEGYNQGYKNGKATLNYWSLPSTTTTTPIWTTSSQINGTTAHTYKEK